MNFLRHNIVTLFLILAVGTVTALNAYTLEMGRVTDAGAAKLVDTVQFQMNVINYQQHQLRLVHQDVFAVNKANNELSEELSQLAHHIRDCHTLLERAGVPLPPNSPALHPCPADCKKCPLKIPVDKKT
jgi:hypothetical protein